MASEQQLTGLNDEIESLRSEKKKWRSLAESRESEISALEKSEKTHLQSQMALTEKLQACQKNLKFYEDKNSEKDTSISTLQKALNAIKKEESAIEALEQELNRKSEELSCKNLKIESQIYNLDSAGSAGRSLIKRFRPSAAAACPEMSSPNTPDGFCGTAPDQPRIVSTPAKK